MTCEAGRYTSTTGGTSCDYCQAGSIGITNGAMQSSCDGQCPRGYYCPSGTTNDPLSLYPCPLFYTSDEGATNILDCYISTNGTSNDMISHRNSALFFCICI
jgi:hypothetical protein